MKRFIALCLVLATLVSVGVTASANGQVDAIYTGTAFKADGRPVSVDTYNINNYGYYKLRDIAAMVVDTGKEFSVDWDGEKGMITLTSGGEYTPKASDLQPGDGKSKKAVPSSASVVINGEEVSFTAYNINGFNYFKLRDICAALNIGVVWDNSTRTSGVATRLGYYDKQPQIVANPTSIAIRDVSVSYSNNSTSLYIGQSTQLDVDVYPANASSGIYWTSSDNSVATVGKTGVVTALKNGTVIITAETYNGKKDTFTIVVPYAPAKLEYQLTADGTGYKVVGCDNGAYGVHIPANYNGLPVVAVDANAFSNCEKLRLFTVDPAQKTFYEENGVLFTDIPVKTLVRFPTAYDQSREYHIPSDTVAIGSYAFSELRPGLFMLNIPEGVQRMGDYVFARNRNWNLHVFIPDSLTQIGANIISSSIREIRFYGNNNPTFLAYSNENNIVYIIMNSVDLDLEYQSPSYPKSITGNELIPANANNRVLYPASKYAHAATYSTLYSASGLQTLITKCDLSAYQGVSGKEIYINLESHWSDIAPDIYGGNEFNFASQSGLYGAGHTDETALLRAYDRVGKLIAMQYVSGDFAFAFPGAYNLGVEGGKNTFLSVIPIEPIYVSAGGDYYLDPDEWHKHQDGAAFQFYVVQLNGATFSAISPYQIHIGNNSWAIDAATGLPAGNYSTETASGYSIYCLTNYNITRNEQMRGSALTFHGMKTLVDTNDYLCMVSTKFDMTTEFANTIYDLLGKVKQTMVGNYFPTTSPLHKKFTVYAIGGDGSYVLTGGTIRYGDNALLANDNYVYIHEMVHSVDLSISAADLVPPAAWMEGRADYITEKVCDNYGYECTLMYPADADEFDWAILSQADKDDFFHYYYHTVNHHDMYAVGYYFLKYLNETYGEDISMKIMANIAALPSYDRTQRSETNAALFKQCVEAATEVGVFQNFVRDVIEK